MKKLIISIGTILIMTFVVIMFVNATESNRDAKKAQTEVKKEGASVPCKATCKQTKTNCTLSCDPTQCQSKKCCIGNGNCDPSTCPTQKECQKKDVKACGKPAGCHGPGNCKPVVLK